ncbi:unnamed protein product [Calypogeia fissa]
MLMAFKMPLLSPSALLSHAKDMQGLNFAYAGATATPANLLIPYPLPYQVEQFRKLKDQVLQTQREQSLALKELDQDTYSDALYTLCIGGNDIVGGISKGLQPQAIIQDIVPDVLNEIVSAIEALYSQGARKFMAFNAPPLGCSTSVLHILEDSGLPVDDLGCITAVNEIDHVLNSELFRSVQRLRASLPNVTIIHFDYYAANVEILSNPTKYGFNPDVVHNACCGVPGRKVTICAMENSHVCDNPDEYMVWDMIHWTEAFYRHIAKFVLNGDFSDPPTNLTKICDLSFEDFGHTTYEAVYHRSLSLSFDK